MVLLLLGLSKTSTLPPWESGVGIIFFLATEVVETLLVVDIEFTDLGHSTNEYAGVKCLPENSLWHLH